MQTRRYRKGGEDTDRFSTEILLVPGGRIQFLERANGTNSNGGEAPNGTQAPTDGAPAGAPDDGSDIPF